VEVILLEKIRNLGALGDQVKVKRGYGRNYLIPQGKAVYATKENVIKFEKRRAELEKTQMQKQEEATARQQRFQALGSIIIASKAGEEGKLFGSIGTRDIAEALINAGVPVEKREIRLPSGALRLTGEYEVTIELHSDVVATIKVQIIPEGSAG